MRLCNAAEEARATYQSNETLIKETPVPRGFLFGYFNGQFSNRKVDFSFAQIVREVRALKDCTIRPSLQLAMLASASSLTPCTLKRLGSNLLHYLTPCLFGDPAGTFRVSVPPTTVRLSLSKPLLHLRTDK